MSKKVQKKICVLGDWASGKTSLVRRYVHDVYDDHYIATIGVKISSKDMVVKHLRKNPLMKVNLTMLLWDLVGQKEFRSVQTTAYNCSNGAFVVCDLTRPGTIDSIEWWIGSLFKKTGPIPIVILANKVDLTKDEIPLFFKQKLEAMAKKYNAIILPTSAKTGRNVGSAFGKMGHMVTNGFFK